MPRQPQSTGAHAALPVAESAIPQPLSPYAVQKLSVEQAMAAAWRDHRLQTVSLRYFNVYGPRQSSSSPYSGLIARLIRLMILPDSKVRPEVFGDGEQSRDFVYIDDVVAANLAAAAAPAEKVAGKVSTLLQGRLRASIRLLKSSQNGLAIEQALHTLKRVQVNVRKSLADIKLARHVLGYNPGTEITQGLARTIDWYRCQIAGSNGRVNGIIVPSIDALRDASAKAS